MDVTLVTGYIPIHGHPRSPAHYRELGHLFRRLEDAGLRVCTFHENVQDTWLWQLIHDLPYDVTHSVADNPAKNSLEYHCVVHQKFEWLMRAASLDPRPQTFVWVDYGIAHVPGVTLDVIRAFAHAVRPNDFAIPGCWERDGLLLDDTVPCWRFCGGLMIVPRQTLHDLCTTVQAAAAQQIQRTRNVTWEVNTLARAEPDLPPVRWYAADHNQTMFTNYAAGPSAAESAAGLHRVR